MLKPIFAALGLVACASIPAHAGTSPGFRDDPAVITEWNTIAEAAIPASAGVTLHREPENVKSRGCFPCGRNLRIR